MERSRGGYRGRYRDRHNNHDLNARNHYEERLLHKNYRQHSSHDNDYESDYGLKNPSNNSYNYRSTRTSYNSRPVSSRNSPSSHYRNHRTHDYSISSHPARSSSPSSPSARRASTQSNYHGRWSPSSSHYGRLSNQWNTHSSMFDEQSAYSNSPSSYHPSFSQPKHADIERNRYPPSSTALYYRRNHSPSIMSPYRNDDRALDYRPRDSNHEIDRHNHYRSPPPRSLPPPFVVRSDLHSERYDMPPNRYHVSSHDNLTSSSLSRHNLYRSSSSMSMSSSSPHTLREQYSPDMNYRFASDLKDYEYSSSMDHQDNLLRDYHPSNRARPNLKRPNSNYDDYELIPSKRSTRQ
ncbi:unnamed protein product [Adineta ricciae]|uniref:Uncharacterized protein n=1 Tax=Adineta ricciae TaxID=249248 RepID=A0A815KA68_ADIRI|nr:unnamed protein product [Adineta ricciae]CAF1387145.1 unnamed protein product [Adineta ricciae]